MPNIDTKREILAKLQELRARLSIVKALDRIEQIQGMVKTAAEDSLDSQLKVEGGLIIKEAFALGPKGEPCPTCAGSGRI